MPLPQLITNPGIVTPQPANAMMQAQKMQRGQMENALMGKQLENYDEDRANLMKKRGREDEEYNYKVLQRQATKAKEFLPQVTPDNYADYIEWNVESVPEKMQEALRKAFKSPEEFKAMTPEQQEAYKLEIAKNSDDLVKTDLETQKSRAKAQVQKQKERAALELEDWRQKNRLELADKKAALKDTKLEKATAYTTPMNQILKEYGGGSGMKITTNPDGTMSFSQGGEKAYQDMAEKAKTDPKAKRDLATYEVLKEKLLATTGTDAVEASTQKRLIFKDGKFIEK